jgi:hypothetical protein
VVLAQRPPAPFENVAIQLIRLLIASQPLQNVGKRPGRVEGFRMIRTSTRRRRSRVLRFSS